MNGHVRVGGDDLLLRGQIGALLEFEVANGTGEGEVAVDTTKVDEATCSANASLLALILGLVIEGERLSAALDAEDRS